MNTDIKAREEFALKTIVDTTGVHAFFVSEGVVFNSEERMNQDGWIIGRCPFHGEEEVSISVNLHTGAWNCHAGCGKGGFLQFIAKRRGYSNNINGARQALDDVCKNLGIKDTDKEPPLKNVSESAIEKWVAKMTDARCGDLKISHGLRKNTLLRYKVGWMPPKGSDALNGLVVIPIFRESGEAECLRLIDSNGKKEFVDGSGSPAGYIYGIDELKKYEWQNVIICADELDRMLFQQEIDRPNAGAISWWHNSGDFKHQWAEHLNGLNVILIYSNKSERNVIAKHLLPHLDEKVLSGDIPSLKIIELPLHEGEKGAAGYFRTHSNKDFWRRVDAADVYGPTTKLERRPMAKALDSIAQIDDPNMADKRVKVRITATGETTATFHSVVKFHISDCAKRHLPQNRCDLCEGKSYEVDLGDSLHLEAWGSSETDVKKLCLRAVCRRSTRRDNPIVEIDSKATLQEITCQNSTGRIIMGREGAGKNTDVITKRIYVHIPPGGDLRIQPCDYIATGWVRTHPKNSATTMLVEKLERKKEEYEEFDYKEHHGEMKALQVLGVQGILEELSKHITHLHDVPELHMAIMLVLCSPLDLDFNGERIRGWMNAGVVGDTGTGKTESYDKICSWLGIGDVFNALSGRRTGLTFAVVTQGRSNTWRLRWGRYPQNTRKVLFVEEIQEMPVNELKSLANAMDSGWLQIDYVASGGYESKTRFMFCANPPGGKALGEYDYGCRALKSLFLPMFIRRMDFCMFAGASENRQYNRVVKDNAESPQITRDMIKSLIYYAWTLPPERIKFDEKAVKEILERSDLLTDTFGDSEEIPLICPSDIRKTLARISATMAILNMSSLDEFETVTILPEHVVQATVFLERIYGMPECGLAEFVKNSRRRRRLGDYEIISAEFKKRLLTKGIFDTDNPSVRVLRAVSLSDGSSRSDISNISGKKAAWVEEFVSFLSYHHIVVVKGGKYFLTPKGIRVIELFTENNPEAEAVMYSSGAQETGGTT